jgi:hypothetical protein
MTTQTILALVVFLQVLTLHAQLPHATKVPLEDHIRSLIGSDAIDCGTHSREKSVPEEMHRSLACARDAETQHKPFRVVQRGPGEDSEFAVGIMGRRDGSVLWFNYDSAPCGGPGCADRFSTKPCSLSDVLVVHDADGYHSFRCGR